MPEKIPTRNEPSETTRFRLAFESSLSAIEAVRESELLPITVDLPSVTATILGALPQIEALAPEVAELPATDATLIEKLEPYALALFEAHSNYLDAIRPPAHLADLVAAATAARDRLYPDAVALANRGLFDAESLAEYRGTTGYKVLAVDLNLLCRGLRRRWVDIEGKTPITMAEIDHAEMVNEQLVTAIGARARRPANAAAAALLRQRAFTLVAKAYDEIRRGVLYLRPEPGEADRIAPSLYAGRGGSRRRNEGAEDAPLETPEAGATPSGAAPPAATPDADAVAVSESEPFVSE